MGAQCDAALSLLDSPDCPLRRADAVLVKGSHGSGAWRIADRLQEGVKEMLSALTNVVSFGNVWLTLMTVHFVM